MTILDETSAADSGEHHLPRPAPTDALRQDSEAIRADILNVLRAHGFDPRTDDVTVSTVMQGGLIAGIAISGAVYERPSMLAPAMSRAEYDAYIGSGFGDLVDELTGRLAADEPGTEVES